jgi:methionine synthase II (cobalamin-independent)
MTDDIPPVRSTGIGSWPGTGMADALKIVFAECPDLPYLPELPARGPYAQMIGRAAAFLSGLAVDLSPAGWRLSDTSSRDHRLGTATLRSDLDLLEEVAQGYAGPVKIGVAGPWTLAANLERPRGDRVLADVGARRDLGQSLAEGTGSLITELRQRLPDVQLTVQLDEPSLPAVLAGSIANASGLLRYRAIDAAEVSATLSEVGTKVYAAGAVAVTLHSCAAEVPISLLHNGGVSGIYLDLDQLSGQDWDAIAACLEDGAEIGLGALPTDRAMTADDVARRVLVRIRDLGMEPTVSGRIVITPACGLASATRDGAVAAMRTVRRAAALITEQLVDA